MRFENELRNELTSCSCRIGLRFINFSGLSSVGVDGSINCDIKGECSVMERDKVKSKSEGKNVFTV